MIPGLHLRSDEEGESLGMDEVEVYRPAQSSSSAANGL